MFCEGVTLDHISQWNAKYNEDFGWLWIEHNSMFSDRINSDLERQLFYNAKRPQVWEKLSLDQILFSFERLLQMGKP